MTMRKMAGRIQRLRLKYSVYQVLERILPDLPHCIGGPDARIINVLLAHDLYTIADLDFISEAVGIQPDAISWSAMICNVMRGSHGVAAALDVYIEAYRRGFRVQTSAADQIIGELVNTRKFYQPDPASIRRAVAIFLQQISTEDKDDDSEVRIFSLLRALTSSTAVPDRDTSIRRILDWMKLRNLPIDLEEPHLDSVLDACFRSHSYSAAVSAISRHTNSSPRDLKTLLGTITRMRFERQAFMPLSAFAAFMHHWESCGHNVDRSVILTYLAGLRESLHALGLPWETRAFAQAGRTLSSARRELKYHVYAFEAYIVDRYPAAVDGALYHALLSLLSTLKVRDVQLFDHLWGVIKNESASLDSYSVSAALEAAWSFDQVARIWADYLDSGASPSVDAWTAYAQTLLAFGQHTEAFSVIAQHIGDNPAHAKGAVSLFSRARSSEELKRYAAALPRTWADPGVQHNLARYREHRLRIGLAPGN